MRNRKDHNAIRLRAIENGEWEFFQSDAAYTLVPRRTGKWESHGARSSFLDGSRETRSLTRTDSLVVGDFCEKLFAC